MTQLRRLARHLRRGVRLPLNAGPPAPSPHRQRSLALVAALGILLFAARWIGGDCCIAAARYRPLELPLFPPDGPVQVTPQLPISGIDPVGPLHIQISTEAAPPPRRAASARVGVTALPVGEYRIEARGPDPAAALSDVRAFFSARDHSFWSYLRRDREHWLRARSAYAEILRVLDSKGLVPPSQASGDLSSSDRQSALSYQRAIDAYLESLARLDPRWHPYEILESPHVAVKETFLLWAWWLAAAGSGAVLLSGGVVAFWSAWEDPWGIRPGTMGSFRALAQARWEPHELRRRYGLGAQVFLVTWTALLVLARTFPSQAVDPGEVLTFALIGACVGAVVVVAALVGDALRRCQPWT